MVHEEKQSLSACCLFLFIVVRKMASQAKRKLPKSQDETVSGQMKEIKTIGSSGVFALH